MNNPVKLVDATERELALDVNHSLIVEAPAGSGKTTLLTQRFLRLLSLSETPESIVAITFSRKAAEEMRTRIVDALSDAEQGESTALDPVSAKWASAALSNAKKKQWGLDVNPRRLRILTIDALAHLIVRRHPLSAGGAGTQQIVEDPNRLYTQAARHAIEEIATNSEWSSAVNQVAAHFDNNWSRLERLLAGMLGVREQWLVPVSANPQRAALEQALVTVVEGALQGSLASLSALNEADLLQVCRFAGEHVLAAKPDADIAELARLERLPTSEAESLPGWRALAQLFLTNAGTPRKKLTKNEGFPAGDAESKRLKKVLLDMIADCESDELASDIFTRLRLISRLPETSFSDWTWQNLQALFTVLKLAAAHLRLVFQQSGMIDFTEISLSALHALGSDELPSDASLLLDYQIEHLLVDEFQDTSVIQYRLIERLIAGWEPSDGRTLFLVGDPMQSIYRFRQADVSRFTDTFAQQRFSQVPMKAISLAANFRSDPVVIDWINQSLQCVAENDRRFPTTTTLSAVRAPNAGAAVAIHGLQKSDSVGAKVVELIHRSRDIDQHQSIAILVRNRSHLSDITAQLREADIAIAATDIDQLLEQPVIGDLVALTRALLHPADRTAWLAILRAPWLALNLVELTHLAFAAGDGLIVDALENDTIGRRLSKQNRERLGQFVTTINESLECVGRMALSELVARTWHALRGTELAKADNAQHYVEKYFRLLNDFEQRETFISVDGLNNFLSSRFVSPAASAGQAVNIMTVHKAKGLEFDTVILPGLNKGSMSDPKSLLLWQETTDQQLLMSLMPAEGKQDRLYDYLRLLSSEAANQERFRLLYVALTRAKQRLHLIGESIVEDGSPKTGSMQEILWPAIDADLTHETAQDEESLSSEEPASNSSPLLRRMTGDILPVRLEQDFFAERLSNPQEQVEFLWASATAKYTGTVIHELLCVMGTQGVENFSRDWQHHHEAMTNNRLTAIGIDRAHLLDASQKVNQAINTVINSERAQWLFSPTHQSAASELPLTAVLNQRTVNVILDRTFVTDEGVRWIVDFKTGEHRGPDVDAFLSSEVERYQPQLERYLAVYQTIEPRPTRLALYFPLLDAWRELPVAVSS